MKRVVITGMGCITSLGIGVEAFWPRLLHGEPANSPVTGVAPGELRFSRAALVQGFDPAEYLSPAIIKLSERSSQFALVASQQAITQAAWQTPPSSVATIFGCSAGGRSVEEPEMATMYRTGGRVHPLSVPRSMANAGTALVAMEHGFNGPAFTLSTACASGTHAIGLAFQAVRSGMVEAAVTGGHEAPLTYGFLKAWDSLRVVSDTWCRPFAVTRDGMSLGEGAAVMVLESYDLAMQRGANILGEIVGIGMSCDAHHMTQPNPDGAARAMRAALADAGLQPEQVAYINAHGTGTIANDASEAQAIRTVFGNGADRLPVNSTKAAHGHAMGASGAIEAVATIQTLMHGMIPPTAGVPALDDSLALDIVTGTARAAGAEYALSNSFAFGGMNAVLAFRSPR